MPIGYDRCTSISPCRRSLQVMGGSVIRHDTTALLETLQNAAWASAFGTVLLGPPAILLLWSKRTGSLPRFLAFVACASLAVALLFWAQFWFYDLVIEWRFEELVPGGSWTSYDEATWSEADRRVYNAYFGDGGRNVFALFAPIPILIYVSMTWLVGRGISELIDRHAA